jgi:hypothetical protein
VRVAHLRGAALLEVELLDVLDQPAAILQRYQAALHAGKSAVLCCAVLCCAVLCRGGTKRHVLLLPRPTSTSPHNHSHGHRVALGNSNSTNRCTQRCCLRPVPPRAPPAAA